MNEQCGNCKWWKLDNTVAWNIRGDCEAPVPIWVEEHNCRTESYEGKTCPVYEERKECEE